MEPNKERQAWLKKNGYKSEAKFRALMEDRITENFSILENKK